MPLLCTRINICHCCPSINYDREQVVDFSMPFLDLGISILYVAAPEKHIDYFSFLAPLSTGVWLLMLGGGVAVSVAINLVSRVSPFETAELDSAEGESPFLILGHCIWFSVASWVQQGNVTPEKKLYQMEERTH